MKDDKELCSIHKKQEVAIIIMLFVPCCKEVNLCIEEFFTLAQLQWMVRCFRGKIELCWVQSWPRTVSVCQHYLVPIQINRCICIVSKPEIRGMYRSLKIYWLGLMLGWGSCSSNVSTMYNIPALLCSADTILNLPQTLIVSEYGCMQRWIFLVFSKHKRVTLQQAVNSFCLTGALGCADDSSHLSSWSLKAPPM